MFAWRGFFDLFGAGQFVYPLEILLLLLNFVAFFSIRRKKRIINAGLYAYIILGLFLLLPSLIEKGPLLTGMGFASVYLNMLIWMYSVIPIEDKELYGQKFLTILLVVMSANAIVSLYQFFIDPSFFGMVTNRYGDESIMSMDNVTRRTVGLMGSPQPFSAACGLSLFIASDYKNRILRLFFVLIILAGGLFSGSRTFGVFFIFWLFYLYLRLSKKHRLVVTTILVPFFIGLGFYIYGFISDNATILRNFAYNEWAAADIFFSSFKYFGWIDYVFGKGFGLEGWSATSANLSFDYSSTESALLSIVYQTGIINALFFILSYYIIYKKSNRSYLCRYLLIPVFINLCVTPAFIGFAYSYIAWGALMMIQSRVIGPER